MYARYSSDTQSKTSIADQFDTCRKIAKLHGWKITHEFSDAAKSGASLFGRKGAADLMAG
jgi:site-specific DNA recombinase